MELSLKTFPRRSKIRTSILQRDSSEFMQIRNGICMRCNCECIKGTKGWQEINRENIRRDYATNSSLEEDEDNNA